MQTGKIKIFFIFLFLSAWTRTFSQPYGNEWINYNQTYYKIKTAKNGIYRITYNDLQAVGFPVTTVDPRTIQLFHRGKEQSIVVSGQLDAKFDPTDYIEFYGTRNDGALDAGLYISPDAQSNPYYNLFSDTTAYFLTWRLDNGAGKRVTDSNENNVNNLSAEPYLNAEKLKLYTSLYSNGLEYPEGSMTAETYSAAYDYGEGWSGPVIGKGNSSDFVLDSLGSLYTSGPSPKIHILITGRNNLAHRVEILAGPSSSSLRTIDTVNFKYDSVYLCTRSLLFSDFDVSGSLTVRVHLLGVDASVDYVSVSWIRLDYTRIPDLNNLPDQEILLPANTSGKSYVEVRNAGDPVLVWNITDPGQIVNTGFNKNGSDINMIVNNTRQGADMLLWGSPFLTPVMEKAVFRNFDASKPKFLIISNNKLMQASSQYSDPVRAYAAYRNSAAGGSMDTLVFEIHNLYNQFSYGEITPLAIRNFCSYLLSQGHPEYLLLIGNSISIGFGYYRHPAGTYQPFEDLVPTFGYPGSDIMFSAGKGNSSYEPAIATGRIPAKTPNEVEAYLNKVKENDATVYDDLWKKNLIHLSGGATSQELLTFKNYVNDFKSVAEGKYLGGNVITVSKTSNNLSTGTVQTLNIADEVNKGKLMITFFGHSAPSVTDIDIGFVSDPSEGYNNKGKYPLILVNGCDAGDIFNTYLSFGEDWIVTPDKGAIGFIALSGVGYPTQLKRFSDSFYSTAFTDTLEMNQPIGKILEKTDQNYINAYTPGEIEIAQVQQSVLQGDPATVLFAASRPDYAVDDNDVSLNSLNSLPVTSLTDSFDISVIVRNYGRVDDSMFYATLTRTLPNGSKINYDPVLFDPVLYIDTLHFTVNNLNVDAYGLNQFDITIDPFNKVKELSKLNNSAHFQYFLSKSGTQNLVPYPYGIVPGDSAHLIAQATDPLSSNRTFTIQIDTIPSFNSPVNKQLSLQASVVADLPVALFDKFTKHDTTVFYWRSRFQDIKEGENNSWSNSSFCFIDHSPGGWIQARPYQLKQNNLTGLSYDSLKRQWNFLHEQSSLQVTTFGYLNPDYNFNNVILTVNGQPFIYNSRLCTGNSLNALAFDYASTAPYLVLSFGQYDILDRRSCGRQPQVINNFLNNEITGSDDYLTQYINNVKTGDYVLLFSIDSVAFQSWSSSLKTKILEIGVTTTTLDSLKSGEPVIILGRKGAAPGSAVIVKADPSLSTPTVEQAITLNTEITGSYTSGSFESGVIGPARSWNNFTFVLNHIDAANEKYSFDIYEINKQGNENLVYGDQTASTSLSGINASQYPFLRVKFSTSNTVSFTPAQLSNWMVSFEGMPEGILLPGDSLQTSGIKKQEGEKFESPFIFRNLSDHDFPDSIRVDYTISNKDLNKTGKERLTIAPLKALSSDKFKVPINTLGWGGTNDLTVYANPGLIPEQYYKTQYSS